MRPHKQIRLGPDRPYDVIVCGAGHAGVEAALAAARMGVDVLLLTGNVDTIAQMSCNPAIGGQAKGHIVREIDALGGEMGLTADVTGIQFRLLNSSKGPAVQAPRAQCDKKAYQFRMKHLCELQDGLTIFQSQVTGLIFKDGAVVGVQTNLDLDFHGKTVVVNVAPGSRMRIDSLPYELLSLTFQRPSGEQIDGKPAPMGIHFLHRDLNGKLVTVVVLLKEGNENPGIKQLWSHMPSKEGPEVKPEGVNFNPANLLPREMDFYSYQGSLTTPPCTEGVRFFILKTTVNIAKEQVQAFPFKMNARPVQALNGREILSN